MSITQTAQATRRTLLAIAILVVAIAGTGIGMSRAADACSDTICVEQAWARATPPGAQNAAVYFSIINNDHADDAVSSISTPTAAQAMLHQTTISGGVARMEMLQKLRIPAHGRVVLTPRSYHVMLTGLKAPLKQGMAIPVTVHLASGRMLQVDVPVLGVAALGPASSTSPAFAESGRAHH